jgi:hypothetical protein
MAIQTHSAALNPLKTVKLAGAGPLAAATLKATLHAALIVAPYSMAAADASALLDRVKHADLLVLTGTLYMSDVGQVADADTMPYGAGEKREIRNCHLLLKIATVYSAGAYDLRLELYS